jgi:ABC-type multidrug transport system ATPase subunit
MYDNVRLDINSLQIVCDPKLYNYGGLRDYLNDFTYSFHSGRIYGVAGDFGLGGWALSYILAGRVKLGKDDNIMVDGVKANQKVLQKLTCYCGDKNIDEPSFQGPTFTSEIFYGKWTIREQIRKGLRESHSPYSFDAIVKMFELSEGRLDRPMEYISNERWRATLAIGFAGGKRIFCCPLLSPIYLEYIMMKPMRDLWQFLKNQGAIIIIPVTNSKYLEKFADEIIHLKDNDEYFMKLLS